MGTVLWRRCQRVLFLPDTKGGRCLPPCALFTVRPGWCLGNRLMSHTTCYTRSLWDEVVTHPRLAFPPPEKQPGQEVLTEAGSHSTGFGIWLGLNPGCHCPSAWPWVISLSSLRSPVLRIPWESDCWFWMETACARKSGYELASSDLCLKHLIQHCPAQPGAWQPLDQAPGVSSPKHYSKVVTWAELASCASVSSSD